MCARAGFTGFFSNHSLRSTAATRLFAANVDEQLIKLKTGHTSDAVRSYKRVSENQLSAMTDVIASKCVKAENKENKADISITTDCSSSGFSSLFNNCNFAGTVNVIMNK